MGDIKTVKKIIDELRFILTKEQKKKSVRVFASMIMSSLLELLGVSAIYPFLDSMMNLENLDDKWYAQLIRLVFPNATYLNIMILLCLVVILVYIVKNVFALFCEYIQYRFSAGFKRELSTLMLKSYLQRPYEFFVNNSSAEVIRGINSDTTATYQILLDFFQFIAELLTVITIGLYLIYTDWFIAVTALALAGVCFLLIVFGFKKKMKAAGKTYIEASTKQFKYSYQAVNGIKEITVMDRRESFISQYEDSAKQFEKIAVTTNFINACPNRVLEGICISGFIGIACIRLAMGAEASTFVPVLGSFALGAFKILPSISKMSSRINDVVYNQLGLANCYENIKEARKLEGERERESLEKTSYKINNFDIPFSDKIVIKDVCWKYKNSNNNVLENLNMQITKGESIALIGSSGAGKTTLADVILGLFRPQQGLVTMDGTDIYRIPHVWAKTVGYVPQSVFLVDDTIRANIAFGLFGKAVDDIKIWDALEKAQLADFVNELPRKLDTIVGERGIKFSGGQRQRVAIARALYENPEILILDEATSALDSETETAVMESIDALLGHKTLIIIAHRLSTLQNCDRVYEIKNGIAVERDKYEVITHNALGHTVETLE